MKRVKVGVYGAAGYTGGEVIRILLNHPDIELCFAHSTSNGGNPVSAVHRDLVGQTDLAFSRDYRFDVDVALLCLEHGQAIRFLRDRRLPPHLKIIDLSQDFRLQTGPTEGQTPFVYGLPEMNRERIRTASRIANPGCFATCIQLALLPLAYRNLLGSEIHISAITGSTGAGQRLSPTTHFSWRNNNVSVYKAFCHQHLSEIRQSLELLQPGFDGEINFIPFRGGFSRGILSSVYLRNGESLDRLLDLYESCYADHPFVTISRENIDVKQVVNTNKGLLFLEKHGDRLLIVGAIDNLLKGAAGQAVQNLNLMCGLEETTGLTLKGIGF